MGHVGLTPQSASALGGYRTQGRTMQQAVQVADDALALQDAGCFAVVFEAVPAAVTEVIMERMRIPVIGIGAGASTDGQVLVFHDLLGLYDGRTPAVREALRRGEAARWSRACGPTRTRCATAASRPTSTPTRSTRAELERFREVIAPGKPWDAADFMS